MTRLAWLRLGAARGPEVLHRAWIEAKVVVAVVCKAACAVSVLLLLSLNGEVRGGNTMRAAA